MSRLKATFDGSVVAEPEVKQVNGQKVLEFPVYVNHTRKDRDTGEYVQTGDVSKIRVSLWRDLADEDIRKGDIVEVTANLVEKEFTKRDGTAGRQIQTEFVDSVVLRYRKPENSGPVPQQSSGGFGSEVGAGFGGGFASAPSGF